MNDKGLIVFYWFAKKAAQGFYRLLIGFALLCASWAAAADDLSYTTHFQVTLDPARGGAQVNIRIEGRGLLKEIQFRNNKEVYSNIRANGKLVINDKDVVWKLPKKGAYLSYFVKINRAKGDGMFDAMITPDWAIFRGDTLIPPMRTSEEKNAHSVATLSFELPEGWKSVETGWAKSGDRTFIIDNPERLFDRPTGWIIAGKLGARQARIKGTQIVVSAPQGESFRRMDVLTFLNFGWREMHKAFGVAPPKLLVVGASDPMWRGGLSAPNSLYLHADRPMVSENGTSPILHELTHMVTRISGQVTATTNDDWIAEGLAEFYSFELLYRADGMTKARRNRILKGLSDWGAEVKHLRKSPSTGKVTARAVILLDELDKELRSLSKGKQSLDGVTRLLIKKRKVSLDDLREAAESLVKQPLKTLDSPLLK